MMINTPATTCLLLFTLFLERSTAADDKPYCTETAITIATVACNKAYRTQGSTSRTLCDNVDCVLECIKHALVDCEETDQFFNYEFETFKVRYRAYCHNYTKSKEAESMCQQTVCATKYLTDEHVQNMQTLLRNRDYAGYKDLECERARLTLDCLANTSFGPSCTDGLDALSRGLETVRFSLSKCGLPQKHPFFTTYSHEPQCASPKIEYDCLFTSLNKRVLECSGLPRLTGLMGSLDTVDPETICSNIECSIKCYLEAVGECYKEDLYVNVDPATITVLSRKMCEDYTKSTQALLLCKIANSTCENEFSNHLLKASQYQKAALFADYKNEICRASRDFKSCASFSTSDVCSDSMADLAFNILQTGFSYSDCGPQDHPYFDKYGGEVDCVTSSALQLLSSLSAIVTFSWLALILYSLRPN